MARYPHFISRAKPGKWPDLVICVDCQTAVESVDGTEERQIERLTGWSANALCLSNDDYYDMGLRSGGDVSSWWRVLAGMSEVYNNVWIISYQCGRIWSLLEFWDQLETGYVSIQPRSVQRADRIDLRLRRLRQKSSDPLGPMSASALSKLLSADAGALVCEDPPSIAIFAVGSGVNKVCWIDWRNYGCERDRDVQEGMGTATAMASWWVHYSRAIRQYALGGPKTTAGSQAMHGWRCSYYKGGVHVHTNRESLTIESDSYYGGRCECFRIGAIRRTVYHVDVRSMYPAICVREKLPARLVFVSAGGSGATAIGEQSGYGRIATVDIESSEPAYPRVRDGITIWPVGRFRTTLAGPELQDAERLGRVVQYHAVAYYDMLPCLKEYAEVLYALRVQSELQSRQSLCQTAKKLLVSLPGKFAQRLRVWDTIDFPGAHPLWGEWWGSDSTGKPCRYRGLGRFVQQDRDLGFGGEAVPAIASWITSAGRMVLLAAIRTAGWDQCYYCDTDSIMVSELGYSRLCAIGCVANRELGKWQLKEVIHDGEIIGIKHYVAKGRTICAGLPKGSTVQLDSGDRFWYTDSPAWQIQGKHKPEPTRRLLSYTRSEQYQHGIVGSDGQVKPIRLEEV